MSREKRVKYITKISKISEIEEAKIEKLKEVEKKFVFRTNDYYNSLIDWSDENDPIKRLVIPDEEEINEEWGRLDASNEHKYTVAKGLEHKYKDTALILFNDMCGAYCRYCFRKRLFIHGNDDTVRDLTEALSYIKSHKEINNVLITGGDPLIASTKKIEPLIKALREIEHIKIIRIGSKMLSFNPYRIIKDKSLIEMIKRYSTPEKRIYIMNHFTHPREITEVSIEAVDLLLKAGAILTNQAPIIRGINDKEEILIELFEKLSFIGVPPYYMFACRPTAGNKTYTVPLEEAFTIFERARSQISGLAARVRLAMSHESGKVEIVALSKENIIFRYHRANDENNKHKTLIFKRNPEARWLDDYKELVEEFVV